MDLGNAAERQNASVNPSLGAMFPPNHRLETRNPRVRDGATPFPPAGAAAPRLGGSPSPLGSRSKNTYANSYFRENNDVTDIRIQMC